MERLNGQVAIVTGGARGIGLGIATVLRAEGADVVIADIDGRAAAAAASRLSGTGEHALAVRADVTAQPDVDSIAAEAAGRWGRIDILAANAGIYPHIPLADIGVADWNRVMAINVTGRCWPSRRACHG
jgi:3-oxoacyl-[acyl-carrier protein] reductase